MSLQIFVTLAALVALVAAQDLTVNTPTSVQECLPVAISWTGGAPPVYVSLIPGGQPGGTMVKDFGAQTGNSLTWNVDQPAGTSLSVQIRDSTGKLNYSDKFNVQPSQSCPAGGKSSSSPAGSTPPAASGGSKPPAASSGSTSPASSSNTTKSPSSPAGGSTPTPTGSGSTSASSPAPGNTNSAATAGSSPAAQAGSDASRTIPAFAVMALAGAVAIFA